MRHFFLWAFISVSLDPLLCIFLETSVECERCQSKSVLLTGVQDDPQVPGRLHPSRRARTRSAASSSDARSSPSTWTRRRLWTGRRGTTRSESTPSTRESARRSKAHDAWLLFRVKTNPFPPICDFSSNGSLTGHPSSEYIFHARPDFRDTCVPFDDQQVCLTYQGTPLDRISEVLESMKLVLIKDGQYIAEC